MGKNNILLFEDFTRLYDRWSAGKDRKEDKFISNISSMKGVDLYSQCPVLFADVDLVVNGINTFTYSEIMELMPIIKKTGWRLPYWMEEIKKTFYISDQPPKQRKIFKLEWVSGKYGSITSEETGETLMFKTDKKFGESYWCEDDLSVIGERTKNARVFEIGSPMDYHNCLLRTNNEEKTQHLKVRLVKDK